MLHFDEGFFHFPPEDRVRKSEQALDADMKEIALKRRDKMWCDVQMLEYQRVIIHLLLKADAAREIARGIR